tara:strand:- start:21579 stop:22199 length:621 start_codon:yes stop_codon:yes gene_type:complete
MEISENKVLLKVKLADKILELNVPEDFLKKAKDFFKKMDDDMSAGWQVNREWVQSPDHYLRGQIAADKLLTALENEDYKLGRLMAGYILDRFPEIDSLELSEQGEIKDHILNFSSGEEFEPQASLTDLGVSHNNLPEGLGMEEALEQAEKDVSAVFKMGRQYRFSIYNHATCQWDQSPAFGNEEEAKKNRDLVCRQRFEAFGGFFG